MLLFFLSFSEKQVIKVGVRQPVSESSEGTLNVMIRVVRLQESNKECHTKGSRCLHLRHSCPVAVWDPGVRQVPEVRPPSPPVQP